MDIIFKDKYKINNLNEGISLKEAIDGIAYEANISIIETDKLSSIGISKGDSIKLIEGNVTVFNGVIWDLGKSKKSKKLNLTCKERTIYIEESEDEYLFSESSATQRIKQYCKDWGIPEDLVDTKIKLSKAIYRSEAIFSMMKKDIIETAKKGGDLYKLRMENKLRLFKIGSNTKVYKLESVLDDVEEKFSLNGMVTQVKVLGKNESDDKKSPIIGTYKSSNIAKYGTIQKILQDEKVDNSTKAKAAAEGLFNTGQDSISVRCKDIIDIRAGDKVSLYGKELYVIDITHDINSVSNMSLNLSTLDIIRKRFYS